MALALLNGKIEFCYWVALGDDLNFPKWTFSELPIALAMLDNVREQLLKFTPKLKDAIYKSTVFKLNAGKQVGSFNLAKCRHITNQTDQIIANAIGFSEVWDDIELLYAQTVKTSFEDDADDEE